jgi:hypothetical protein
LTHPHLIMLAISFWISSGVMSFPFVLVVKKIGGVL